MQPTNPLFIYSNSCHFIYINAEHFVWLIHIHWFCKISNLTTFKMKIPADCFLKCNQDEKKTFYWNDYCDNVQCLLRTWCHFQVFWCVNKNVKIHKLSIAWAPDERIKISYKYVMIHWSVTKYNFEIVVYSCSSQP